MPALLRGLIGFLLVTLLFCAPAQHVPSPHVPRVTALVGGTVVSAERAAPLEDATVPIEGNRIAAVGPAAEVHVPDGAEVIDTEGQFVLPGLIDAHVHFFQSGGLYTRPDILDLRFEKPYERHLDQIKERLPTTFRRYLASGVTGVVDVGGPMWNLHVRARADTMAMAPRVAVAGPLLSPVQPPELTTGDPPILKVETPEAARRHVREQAARGVDLVKIWYIVRPGETPAAFRPVVEAIIDEAHAHDTRAAVHATGLETARAAVEAGADVLVHSVSNESVDQAFIRLLKEREVIYTPAIMVMERYAEVFAQQLDLLPVERALADPHVLATLDDLRTLPADSLPAGVRQQMQRQACVAPNPTAMDNLRRLEEAGVTIAAGTDAGNIGTPHGPALHYELRLMQRAGLTPMAVLRAATWGGACVMGRAEELGTVEAGKLADLIVLEENPLDDLAHLADLRLVIKGGHVFQPENLLPAAAER